MQVYLILALIFAILVAAFAIQNTAVVTVHFLFWQGSISLVLVILGSVAAGALIFFVLGLIKQIAYGKERRELVREKERLTGRLAEQKRELEAAEERLKEALETARKGAVKQGQTAGTAVPFNSGPAEGKEEAGEG